MERLTRVVSASLPSTPNVHAGARQRHRTPDALGIDDARPASARKEDATKNALSKIGDQKDAERKDAERKDAERKDAERKDAERKDAERKDAERKDAERKDAARIGTEKVDGVKKDAVREDAAREDVAKIVATDTDGAGTVAATKDAESTDGTGTVAATKDTVRPYSVQMDPFRTPRPALRDHASVDRNHSHGRATPGVETSRKYKRSSLTIPINPNAAVQSPVPSPTRVRVPPSLPGITPPHVASTDSHFLTALAAQERRVFELKEELEKAEAELRLLKQDWAIHEAQRKRHDMRRSQRLKPMSSPTAASSTRRTEDDSDGSSAWMVQEMERRKALMQGSKQSNRTVFSGSRHTRTLSLLSPVTPSTATFTPQHSHAQSRPRSPTAPERPNLFARLSADRTISTELARGAHGNIEIGIPADALMKTGKQIATDFKDGLWTFIEDLRQATVGEEGINGTVVRSQNSHNPPTDQRMPRQQGNLKSQARSPAPLTRSSTTGARRVSASPPAHHACTKDDSALLDIDATFWAEHGVGEANMDERTATKSIPKRNSGVACAEAKAPHGNLGTLQGWEKAERIQSDAYMSEYPDKPRTLTPDQTKRDAIPWPALTKLASSSLRQTASNLMADWEKSLTPPVEDTVGQSDYLGRTVSPLLSLPEDKRVD